MSKLIVTLEIYSLDFKIIYLLVTPPPSQIWY